MHPSHHAKISPDRAAVIMDSGETVTFGELDARSNQGARLLRASGLAIGDTLAVVMDNNVRYMEIAWAAQRAGLYLICGDRIYRARRRREGDRRVQRHRRRLRCVADPAL